MYFSLLLWTMTGCASHGLRIPGPLGSVGQLPAPPEFAAPPEELPIQTGRAAPGDPVARAAEHYVGKDRLTNDGALYRWDCSGLVEATYARAGLPITGSSSSLYERAKQLDVFHTDRRPEPGDVAFFEDTYDRDGDGRTDDGITHVAVVTSVSEDGTITMVHKGGTGVTWLVMNLYHPDQYQDEAGQVINSYLRRRTSADPRGTRYLAGELSQGFASFWRLPAAPS